jgi:hypothetical protein
LDQALVFQSAPKGEYKESAPAGALSGVGFILFLLLQG